MYSVRYSGKNTHTGRPRKSMRKFLFTSRLYFLVTNSSKFQPRFLWNHASYVHQNLREHWRGRHTGRQYFWPDIRFRVRTADAGSLFHWDIGNYTIIHSLPRRRHHVSPWHWIHAWPPTYRFLPPPTPPSLSRTQFNWKFCDKILFQDIFFKRLTLR